MDCRPIGPRLTQERLEGMTAGWWGQKIPARYYASSCGILALQGATLDKVAYAPDPWVTLDAPSLRRLDARVK